VDTATKQAKKLKNKGSVMRRRMKVQIENTQHNLNEAVENVVESAKDTSLKLKKKLHKTGKTAVLRAVSTAHDVMETVKETSTQLASQAKETVSELATEVQAAVQRQLSLPITDAQSNSQNEPTAYANDDNAHESTHPKRIPWIPISSSPDPIANRARAESLGKPDTNQVENIEVNKMNELLESGKSSSKITESQLVFSENLSAPISDPNHPSASSNTNTPSISPKDKQNQQDSDGNEIALTDHTESRRITDSTEHVVVLHKEKDFIAPTIDTSSMILSQ